MGFAKLISDLPTLDPLIRVTAMPADTNPFNGVFAARLMKAFEALVETPLVLVA